MKKFLIKDVRCFKGEQVVDICPITFLIGENSTGKTTLLGCMQALMTIGGKIYQNSTHQHLLKKDICL